LRSVVAGRIPVLECLRAGKRKGHVLHLLKGAKGLEAVQEAAGSLPLVECSRHELDDLAGGVVHQGVVLEADALPLHRAEDWLSRDLPGDTVVVVLDGVEDPHNFGAIVRSAAACGARAVLFGKDRAAPISPASVKSAAGAMEYVDLVQCTNLVRALKAMQQAGFWVAALDAEAPQTLWQADLTGRIALVIGSEGKGIRPLVRKNCDLHLRIPLTGPITSLNASVSAAMALSECLRQRS
jgi:23S rRNA (guanosine2251-2'-O)-methyltransferase